MKSKLISYLIPLFASILLCQFFLVSKSKNSVFPLSTWDLFSTLPQGHMVRLLYFKDLATGEICYFYLCPKIKKGQLNSTDLFHFTIWNTGEVDLAEYIENQGIDLQELNYEIVIREQEMTMLEVWSELRNKID